MGLTEDVKLSAYWEATQYFSFCLVIYFYSFQDREISVVPKGGSHTYTPGCTFPSLFSYLYYSHAIEDNVIQVGERNHHHACYKILHKFYKIFIT